MRVEHEADEGALKARTGAHVDGKASARELGGSLKIENAESFADFPVRLGCEIEFLLFAPGFDGFVVGFGDAGGDFVASEVGNAGEGLTELFVEIGGGLVELVELLFQGASLFLNCGGFVLFARLHECADLLRELVAAGFALLCERDGFATATIESAKISEQSGGIGTTRAQLFFNQLQVGTNEG